MGSFIGSRTILLSKRANIFYVDKVRVMVENERIVFRVIDKNKELDYNLPDCNTSLVLLGKGSSITDAAVRYLAKSSVMIGFAGTGGTPLHAATDFVFMSPQDEYRPTEYAQRYLKNWFDPQWRLRQAKSLQKQRIVWIKKFWNDPNIFVQTKSISLNTDILKEFEDILEKAQDEQTILLAEARLTKQLYGLCAHYYGISNFKRVRKLGMSSVVNSFLDHGNYLMYGCSAVALHALGIPNAFALLHGKTRRGALVFDMADILKDAMCLPMAFECASLQYESQKFRNHMIEIILKKEVLDILIESLKEVCSCDME